MKNRASNIFFKLLYFCVNFLIYVGEVTRKLILLPFIILFKIIVNIYKYIKILQEKLLGRFHFPRKSFRAKLFKGFTLKFKYLIIGSVITLVVMLIFQTYNFVKSLPSPGNIGKANYPLSTHILDRNGKLLYEIYREQNRTPIHIEDLPTHITQATVAIEDKEFYKHNGISFINGFLRAVKDSFTWGTLQGGSTITQQLVKTSLLTPERTVQRKLKEIILALWTEKMYTKNQILEMYLNQVPYGGSAYGVEEASKTYFDKSAKELTLSEAALIAGLPVSPSLYSPYVNPNLARQRRNEILALMEELNFITSDQMIIAQREDIDVVPIATRIAAPHFVFYVKSQLENIYGIKQVEEGGMKVITTLDLEIQKETEKILNEELEKIKNLNVTNGAVLVTRPQTGEILAMVGSRDYFASPSGAFNVTIALRQPGSSIKPIMYSAALERNFTASTIIDDSPITYKFQGGPSYSPVNYDGRYHGRVPLRLALANSFNVPAVKVLNSIGIDDFVRQGKKMGITTWTDSSRFGLSLTLGGGEVMMVDMATAYGVLANQGYKIRLNHLVKLENNHGDTIEELSPSRTKVVNEGVSYILSDILADNFARQLAFGQRSMLQIPGYKVAVKTGTTDEKKDNWTIGYTPEFMVTVWVGNNDGTPMNKALASGVTGAAPIWNRVMTYILKTYGNGNSWYSKPENVVEKTCYFGRPEYFLKGTETKATCKDLKIQETPTPLPNNYNRI